MNPICILTKSAGWFLRDQDSKKQTAAPEACDHEWLEGVKKGSLMWLGGKTTREKASLNKDTRIKLVQLQHWGQEISYSIPYDFS